MIFTTPETISLVRTSRRDQFLAAMFLPPALREVVINIYALDIELEHVHHVVKEEMMGHIRYAWWQEAIEQLINEGTARPQPLLQTFVKLSTPLDFLLPIVTAYREHYPNPPAQIEKIIQEAVEKLICHPALVAGYGNTNKNKKWQKATNLIHNHRSKHGDKHNNWLLMKLLFV